MRIATVHSGICVLHPPVTARTAIHRIDTLFNVVVEVRAEGLAGHGYACAFTPEQANAIHALIRDVAATLVGRDTVHLREWWTEALVRLNFVGRGGPSLSALAALDTATWDLHARAANLPVHHLLGASTERIPVYATGGWLDLDDDELVREALGYEAAGYAGYKMKVGNPDWRADIRRVTAVRVALRPQTRLYVDANQAWSREEAVRMARHLHDCGADWLEEPIDAEDIAGQAGLRAGAQVPIAAGETVFGVDGVSRLVDSGAADIVTVDLARCAGPTGFLSAAAVVAAAHIPLAAHTYTEASARLLASTEHGGLAEHVPGWWDELFETPPDIHDGHIWLGNEPGFGPSLSRRARSSLEREARRGPSPRVTKPPNGWPARVAVLGAGSIGSYIGTLLSRAGQDVTLVDQWPEHVEALHSGPMRISGPDIDDAVPVRALHLHQLQAVEEPFDLLLLAVKGYDTDWAATLARGVLASNGAVLVCQNGLTDARVARIVGAERTLGCVITIAAAMAGPGQVARTDRYDIGFRVGELDGHVTARAQRLAELMSAAGGAEAIADLAAQRWSKLATNCMVNAVAGITGLGAGEIRSDPAVLPVVAQLAAETITVGWSLGHEVSPIMGIAARQFVDAADGRGLAELGERLRSASRSTSGHPPSLLQDVRRGRRTEINELNGEVARLGAEQGIATPLCDTVVRIVSQAGIGRLVPDLANLSLLLDALPATARSPLM